MLERSPNTEKFRQQFDEIAAVYQRAFAGYPWFKQLPDDEVRRLLLDHSDKDGFQAFIAESPSGQTVGALWYDELTVEEVSSERGQELARFADIFCKENDIGNIIWEREVLVDPSFQKQGIATKLRMTFLSHLAEVFPNGALVLTRMRDDNTGIIKIAERLDYERTGIRVPSSHQPIFHEYWYKPVLQSSS